MIIFVFCRADKTKNPALKARLWIACPIRQTAQSRVFKSYLLEPNRAQFFTSFCLAPMHISKTQPLPRSPTGFTGTTTHKNDHSAVYPHFLNFI